MIIEQKTDEAEEIIVHAEEAYEKGEITEEDLLWLRVFIAKEQVVMEEE